MGKKHPLPLCEVIVKPSGSGLETRLVLLAALLTVIVCGGIIMVRHATATVQEAPSWQMNAFTDLRSEELATFNALYTAAPEIEAFHEDEDGRWPSVTELRAEFVPPFVQDAAWQRNGGLDWARSLISTSDKHIACYLGSPMEQDKSGSFLLIMLHGHVKKEGNAGASSHVPYEIWLHASPVAEFPDLVTDQALINAGWRVVVARKGEDEMRRTKGEGYIQ
ncbi:DUF6162 family protein [Pseudodesulfovibrio piezophilus]|nr:hypothetical protein [Pseudodesulfovibrio piezophilus]